ncbi:hypothetical protein NAEGRDRAFT_79490 [Naegleria gruberi]|uniref:RZ-type domain-containing protein n=1 Tax=Naegleria gruberi TaxID=5762 RepID=D2VDC3_NAEGR|nr:uncharacterized protein NAEGRDRAFT_79490 [Naegleria gruberi]EFC45119.1 hypothetical protein NAEGRDRAFT_79490 [Naegleria gruberi]|eukprot:XP_002677863.1 hypothetical protein NAEGRDRAFT_79490 [Naegleria gruberi strain NEG-M]
MLSDQDYQKHKRRKEEEEKKRKEREDESSLPSSSSNSTPQQYEHQTLNNNIVIIDGDDTDSNDAVIITSPTIQEQQTAKFGFLVNSQEDNNNSSSSPHVTGSSNKKRKTTSHSPLTTNISPIKQEEDMSSTVPPNQQEQTANNNMVMMDNNNSNEKPSTPKQGTTTTNSDEDDVIMIESNEATLSPSLLHKMQGSLKIEESQQQEQTNTSASTTTIPSSSELSDNNDTSSKPSEENDQQQQQEGTNNNNTVLLNSVKTITENTGVRIVVHAFIPPQYTDDLQPALRYSYKEITGSGKNKKEEVKKVDIPLGHTPVEGLDIWFCVVKLPLQVDFVSFKIIVRDESKAIHTDKEVRSITLPKYTTPAVHHIYINFNPKSEKRQGILDMFKTKLSMTETFLTELFTPSKIDTGDLLPSDTENNVFENLIRINRKRIQIFHSRLDGFMQSMAHLSDLNFYTKIHIKQNYTSTNRHNLKSPYVYEDTKKFLLSLPEKIIQDKTDFELKLIMTLVFFEKIYSISGHNDKKNFDEMIDLLKELDVYTLNTIFHHILKKEAEKSTPINLIRDSFRNSIQALINVFSATTNDKRKFSYWIMAAPFISLELKFHGSTSPLDMLIMQSDKKRFDTEFATLTSIVEEKRALISNRSHVVSGTDIGIIFSTIFKMASSLNDINCILTLTSDMQSNEGRFRSFTTQLCEFISNMDSWEDSDFDSFTYLLENHSYVLSSTSMLASYFKNKALSEVSHYHSENILKHLLMFLENEEFVANNKEKDLISLSKLIANFFSTLFGKKKSSYNLFKKSVYSMKDIVAFYSKLAESLSKTCMNDYQLIIIESISNNSSFTSSGSDPYSRITSLIEICEEFELDERATLGNILAQLTLDTVKSLGVSNKVINKLLDTVSRFYADSIDITIDVVSKKVLMYIIETLSEGSSMTIEILFKHHLLWSRLFQLNDIFTDKKLIEGVQLVDKFSQQINNHTIALNDLRIILRDDNQDRFVSLATYSGVSVISKNTLIDIDFQVQYFETLLKQCHDFCNHYCQHDNVNNEFRLLLEKIEAEIQNNAVFSSINSSFNNFAFLKELPTLQHLCKSELFLQFWNETIDQMVESLVTETESTSKIIFTINDLKSRVYPQVVQKWLQLYNNLNMKTISFLELQTLFSDNTEEETFQDMLFLKRTCQSTDNMLDGDATQFHLINENNQSYIQWSREHAQLISSFLTIVKQKEYIPMIVSILSKFNSNFSTSVFTDSYYVKIEKIHKYILEKWESGNLFDIVDMVNEAKSALQHLGKNELLLIEFLNESDDLLNWLWQHNDSSQFNELIRVCREVTDDAIILQSFASLTSAREYLYELVYPSRKFTSCESFLRAINTANLNKDDTEIQRRLTDCKVIRSNLENVKQVFKEKTRSPSVTAVLKLLEIISGATISVTTINSISEDNYIICNVKGKITHLSDLIDIRTTVLNTTIPNELKEKHINLDAAIDTFCKLVNILSSMKRTLIELGINGSMIVDNYEFTITLNVDNLEYLLFQFMEEEKRLSEMNSNWKLTIKNIRLEYNLLNYFNMRELRKLIKWLDMIKEGNSIVGERVYSMLKIIDNNLTLQQYKSFEKEWIDYDIMVDDDIQLISLGSCLNSHFNLIEDSHEQIDFLPSSDLGMSTMNVEKNNSKQNLIVIACQNDQEVESIVYSLYAVKSILPQVEEVLMCRPNTDFEDIELVVRRWSKSEHKKQIFTLANIQHLDYTLQCKVVDMLKNYLQTSTTLATLAIVSSTQQQRIINAFSNFRFDGSPLSSEDLKDSLLQIAKPGKFSSGVNVYTSPMAGCGKSHTIFERSHIEKKKLVYISLRESVNITELINQLNEKTRNSQPVTLHFNIAPNVDTIVNSILFELIVIGSLRDHQCNVYHRRPIDSIAIEIPNQVGNRTLVRSVPFCKYLPRVECIVSAHTLSIERKYEIGTNGSVMVSNNRKLKYVCSLLLAHQNGVFVNNNGTDFVNFTPNMDNMNKEECLTILTRYCNAGGQISYALINNFVEFTFEFFENMMDYEVLRFLPSLDPGFATLPQSIVGMILEMSKDFAIRQLVFNFNTDNPSLEEYSNRFSSIRKWEESSHPVIIFTKETFQCNGFNVISLDQSSVNRFFPEHLRALLHEQGININFDFKKTVEEKGQRAAELEGLKFLQMISGSFSLDEEMGEIMKIMLISKLDETDYVLTQDNLMKMIAIIYRFKSNLPVILHGESGGGKTYLISHLCKFLDYQLYRMTLHGGNTEQDIFNFLNNIVIEANSHAMATYVAFIDECNTCSAMAIVKEVVCDGLLNGVKIPENVKIVAALNPYRLKNEKAKQLEQSIQSQTGIIYKHPSFANIPDPLENLVYRVHPLPDSFVDHLYDFGSLSDGVERLYIGSMLRQSLKKYLKADENGKITNETVRQAVNFFESLIHASQVFIRQTMHEESSVSLRDVRRCIQVFYWLVEEYHNPTSVFRDVLNLDHHHGNEIFNTHNKHFKNYVMLSLSFAFYSRLNRQERSGYLRYLSKECPTIVPSEFEKLLTKYQTKLTEQMNISEGIALNEALTENIFVLFLALVNHIPLLIQGYPGTCKSLAVDLISKSMRGKASNNKQLQHLPDINIFAFQCSPLSEAKSIAQTFRAARQYAKESSGSSSLSVVLLDEIGLAADSPKLPLKILHQELENTAEISVVSISNYSLDSSKMNRMCVLYRSTPSAKDLKDTAKGIMRFHKSFKLQSYLEPIATSYLELYKNQRIKQFFGLRDFYNLVKFLYRIINNKMTYHGRPIEFEKSLVLSVLRNFGGIPSEDMDNVLKIFERNTGIKFTEYEKPNSCNLLRLNLKDSADARHLLVLTNNNSALNLLFDYEILSLSSTIVLFGSDFPDEKNDNFSLSLQLQKIKLAMSEGNTVVLVHCDSLYESLYDLLNQHYVVVENKKFSRLAFGNSSVTCPVHDNFRIIIIAEASDAYTKLAIPFLNRMEKHVILRDDMMNEDNTNLHSQLSAFVEKLMAQLNEKEISKVFIGSHKETLKSLVQSIEPKDSMVDEEITEQMDIAFDKLLWNMTPEAVIKSKNERIMKHYFEGQEHSSLPSFLNNVFTDIQKWQDKFGGIQAIVTTFSSLLSEVELLIRDHVTVVKEKQVHLQFLELHDMKTSSDLNTELDHFFASNHKESMLVLLCDPVAASTRRIHYAQYTCESKRNTFNAAGTGNIRHVIFLVNLSRIPTESSKYSFDFDRRWNYVFIDDVSNSEQQQGFPELFELVNTPFSNLINNTLSVEQIILENLHNSLSRIVYPFPRSSSQIQSQLSMLRKWLSQSSRYSARFTKLIREKVIDIVKHSIKNDEQWYLQVINNDKNILQICGTLRSAIHYFISRIVFMAFSSILSVMDRYNNLQLLDQENDSETPQLWLDVFEYDVHSKLFESAAFSMNQSGYVNILQGTSKHFDAKFPFSFIFATVANSFRVNHLVDQFSREDLEKHFEFTLPRFVKYHADIGDECIVDDDIDMNDEGSDKILLPNDLVSGYINDYHYLFGSKNCNMLPSENDQLVLIHELISKDRLPDQYYSLLDSQISYWNNEKRVKIYFQVFDSLKDKNVLEKFLNSIPSCRTIAEMDMLLCELVIVHFNPEYHITLESDPVENNTWVRNVRNMTASMTRLLDLLKDPLMSAEVNVDVAEKCSSLSHQWKCIKFFAHFLKDLVISTENLIDSDITKKYWEKLNGSGTSHFYQPNALVEFLQTLTDINKKCTREESSEDFECFICLSVPDPDSIRTTVCCKRYICYDCADEFCQYQKKSKQCGWCQKELDNDETVDTYTIPCSNILKEVEDISQKETLFIEKSTKLIETFITMFCVERGISDMLIRDIISYICENKKFLSEHKLLKFILSDSMKSSIIRALFSLKRKDPNQFDHVAAYFEENLKVLHTQSKNVDFPIAVSINQILEDEAEFYSQDEEGKINLEYILQTLSRNGFSLALGNDFVGFLNNTSIAKVAVKYFVKLLLNNKLFDQKSAKKLVDSVGNLFTQSENLMLYFLRELTSVVGLSETRDIINNSQLLGSIKFIQQWKEKEDVASFLKDSVLSLSNPFLNLPLYEQISKSISEIRLSNTDTLFTKLYTFHRERNSLHLFLAGVLVVVLEEVTLSNKMGTRKFENLKTWVDRNQQYFQLLGGISIHPLLSQLITNKVSNFANINPETLMTQIQQLRCIIHLMFMIFTNSQSLGFFSACLLSPQNLLNNMFPTMNDDVMSGLSSITNGRIYQCPSGHLYIITECGRAATTGRCPECGQEIGGSNHNLLNTNREYFANDQSAPTNLCRRNATEESGPADVYLSQRSLSPIEVRFIRLVMSGLLFASSSFLGKDCAMIINTRYANPRDVSSFFFEHFINDWNILSRLLSKNDEQVSIIVHNLITRMTLSNVVLDNQLMVKTSRENFERLLSETILQGALKSDKIMQEVENMIRNHQTSVEGRNNHKNEKLSHAIQFTEIADRDVVKLQPSLFMKLENITFDHFSNTFKQSKNDYPILSTVIEEIVSLQALQYLPDIFKMYVEVCKRCDKKLRKEQTIEQNIGQFINDIQDPIERENLAIHFDGFARAWNMVFKYVEMYECLVIPEQMKTIRMGLDKPLVFILPHEKDESIFGIALTHYLIGIHNKFVKLTNSAETDVRVISSSDLDTSLAFKFSLKEDLMPFVRDHCRRPISFKSTDSIKYDFEFIQQHVVDHFLSGKPLVEIKIKMIELMGELRASGAKERFTNLKKTNKNSKKEGSDKFTDEERITILNELGGINGRSDRCVKCFRMVEMAIHFIQANTVSVSSLSSNILEKPLVQYLEKDLMMTGARQLFGASLSSMIRIKHLDNLWELLESHLTVDSFSSVHANYRKELSKDLEQILLTKVAPKIDLKVFLSALKEAIQTHLTEPYSDMNQDLKQWLSYLPIPDNFVQGTGEHANSELETISDFTWFKHVPDNLFTLAMALEVFKTLETLVKQ